MENVCKEISEWGKIVTQGLFKYLKKKLKGMH